MSGSYEDNFEAIFGKGKKVDRGAWVWDADKKKLVPRADCITPNAGDNFAGMLKPIDPFISPIDGTVISCRSTLRKHNREHGVTNIADYGEDYFARRKIEMHNESTGNTREAKQERIETIMAAMRKHDAL